MLSASKHIVRLAADAERRWHGEIRERVVEKFAPARESGRVAGRNPELKYRARH